MLSIQMLRINVLFLIGIFVFGVLIMGCGKPDLAVEDVVVNWDAITKTVTATIKNQGQGNATDIMVYFTPYECPVSSNYRPQTRHTIPQLASGETTTLNSEFAPLSRTENANLGNVRSVVVTADPKNFIDEEREDNNESTGSLLDISGLSSFTYDEGLSTILRGLRINLGSPVMNLNIPEGYYRIREFRVWGQPNEKVVTLSIKKPYAELVTGSSILPKRQDEWVFSIIEEDTYNSNGRKFKGHDFHGHTLAFQIDFGTGCSNVVYAKLDCVDVALSTQTYTTSQLNSCGWSSEPLWTTP